MSRLLTQNWPPQEMCSAERAIYVSQMLFTLDNLSQYNTRDILGHFDANCSLSFSWPPINKVLCIYVWMFSQPNILASKSNYPKNVVPFPNRGKDGGSYKLANKKYRIKLFRGALLILGVLIHL